MPPARQRGYALIESLKENAKDLRYLMAVDDNDEKHKVAVPDVRRRWQRAMKTLAELKWVKVEMYNKNDELLGVHARNADDEMPAGELEDLGPGPVNSNNVNAQALQIACHWIVKGQELALSRAERAQANTLDALNRMIDSTIKRFEVMDKYLGDLMRMSHALNGQVVQQQLAAMKVAMRSNGDADEESESGKALEQFGMALVQSALAPKEKPVDNTRRDHEGERRDREARRNGHNKERQP